MKSFFSECFIHINEDVNFDQSYFKNGRSIIGYNFLLDTHI